MIGVGDKVRSFDFDYCRDLTGERACPPEDCGGPYHYPEMLAALSDSDHEDHEHYLDWIGEFDAESFDLNLANKRLQALAFPSRSRH